MIKTWAVVVKYQLITPPSDKHAVIKAKTQVPCTERLGF